MEGMNILSSSPSLRGGASRNGICSSRMRGVARYLDVMRDYEWEPAHIVRASRADAQTGFRMPPVLHVSFEELPGRGRQNVRSRKVRREVKERERILQLIAISERAARLVQRGAAPESAAQRLVGQPAIQQKIDGEQRGAYLQRSESIVPPATRFRQRLLHLRRRIVAGDDLSHCVDIRNLAHQEGHFGLLSGLDRNRKLERGGRIEPGPSSIVETYSSERRRAGRWSRFFRETGRDPRNSWRPWDSKRRRRFDG